jgi:hypothetical protein
MIFAAVALTDLIMKNFERLFGKKLSPEVALHQDPLQFAYSPQLGVEDAVLTLLHHVYQHLDKNNAAVRLLFIDFSSAFNTIPPCKLARLLIDMDVNPYLILWICSFLSDRSQKVRFKTVFSESLVTNTGAPQGCVLSPLLFTLYTSRCRSNNSLCKIIKYADDTVIAGLVTKNQDNSFFTSNIDNFVDWCDSYHLHLNVKKTKELIIDFGRKNTVFNDISINGENVQRVDCYRYLGTIIDNKLSWTENIDALCAKSKKRIYFLRKLNEFQVDNTILRLFFDSIILSVLSFSLICWYGGMSISLKNKLSSVIRTGNKIINDDKLPDLDDLYRT